MVIFRMCVCVRTPKIIKNLYSPYFMFFNFKDLSFQIWHFRKKKFIMDIIDNSTDIFLIMHFSLHVRIESTDGKDVQLLMEILYSSNAKVENLISVAFRIPDSKHIIHWCTYVHWYCTYCTLNFGVFNLNPIIRILSL